MAKNKKTKGLVKKIVAWILLIAMILSIFAYAFSVFA